MDEQQYEYRTGRTHPRKSRNGMVAGLLMCIILLGGIASVLGIKNIHLFQELEKVANGSPVSFFHEESAMADTLQGDQSLSLLVEGMSLQELPALYQRLYDLPAGLYVCKVAKGSHAEALGIAPGDVLTAFAGEEITTLDGLQARYSGYQAGDRVALTVYRNGQEKTVTLTIE